MLKGYGSLRGTPLLVAGVCLSAVLSLAGQSTIGPPSDGVHYSLDSASEVTKADVGDCGFNDASVPNTGIFRREERSYEEIKDGKTIRRWHEAVDTFLRCHEP